jgi:hypothetical protein
MADAVIDMNDVNRQRAILLGVHLILREFLDESSSSSDEELNVAERLAPYILRGRRRRKVPRLKNYIEEVMPQWTDIDFKSHFG